ncbi:Uncharacterised protein [uncultured archaeon]|nr:Uncharacterised protein [uncultured archaeon]
MAKKKKTKRKVIRKRVAHAKKRRPVKHKKVVRKRIIHKKVNSKAAKKRKLVAVARKKARLLLHSPQFFVLASHPAMYTRPPAHVREKLKK